MHEYSIVSALIEQCERYAKENSATKILRVVLKIGTQSGVVPELLESAFNVFKIDSICKDAILEIEISSVIVKCQDCGYEFEPKDYSFLCPKCSSINTKMISGKEMHLMRLEME